MKRFLSTVGFCVFLFVCGLFFLLPSTQAEKNLLQNLLNLPAPPSPDSLVFQDRTVFPPDFFSKNKPPADDAPLEELLAYWRSQSNNYRELAYNIKPSERSLQRIVSEIEGNPEKLTEFLNVLPDNTDTADFVKRIYDSQVSREDVDEDWGESVKKWLIFHSKYFSDDLLAVARKVGDTDEYVTNQDELLALARVDWDKARPILERLYNDNKQPVSQTLARWAFYRHALDEDSASDIEKYRSELKAVVENKSATAGMRDLAIDALVKEKEWDGLDDWYSTLVEDETLADLRVNGRSYTGLTTIMYYSPPEKRLEKMLQLVKSNNPTVRNAAVRNLAFLLDKNPEVAQALLPWLENADWAKEVGGERRRLISALGSLEMPESVPGLIAVLNEKQSRQKMGNMMSNSMNSMANSMMTNSNRAVVSNNASAEDYFPFRSEAIGALAKQKDARAIAPLRAILPEVENWQIHTVVRALLECGGFSIPEQIEALEFIAKNNKREIDEVSTGSNMAVASRDAPMPPPGKPMPPGFTMMGSEDVRLLFNPSNIKPILGIQLTNQPEAEESLVAALISRIAILDEKDPPLAFGLRKIMQNWQGAAINALMLRDLKNNKSDVDAVVKLLSLRKELRDKQWNEVSDIRGGSPTALGIAACLTENVNEYDALLRSESIEAKTAMLACARLIRAALPVRNVAGNLKSPNKLLALAAERYLEMEDSPEAQAFVLSMHPNEAKILGAKKLFIPDDAPVTNSSFLPALFSTLNESNFIQNYYYLFIGSNGELAANEKILQREIKATQELLGVYAYDDNYIRIYKDRAVFSWQTDKARYHERALSKEEFDGFKNYLAAERVNEMPQFISDCRECGEKELLMLGRNGGRRIFLLASEPPRFFIELEKILTNLRQPPAKLRYAMEKDVAGLEILYADENLPAEAVWKNGADFRVLLSDEMQRERIDDELEKLDAADASKAESSEEGAGDENIWVKQQKRRAQREFENFAWHKYADKKLAGTTDQPKQAEYIPIPDGAGVRVIPGQWKARTATFEMRSDAEGLYKIAGGRAVKIRSGYYDDSIVTTPNGRWAIARKYVEDEGPAIFRVNLTTKKEFPVKSEEYPQFEPVVYVPAINKVLIFGGFGYEETGDTTQKRGEYFFLDAETGAINKAKGEVRPLAQQTFRPLQSNGKPDEFWAAIPDAGKNETNVGIYNAKTLVFKSITKLPQIQFNSMQMWIDADVIYFVYEGHLLSLPLQPKTDAPVTN